MIFSKELGLNNTVVHAQGLVAADMDGETVMMNIETGKYYGLDGIGSCIWELIEEPHTVCEVVHALLADYDVDEKTCQNDVVAFLNKLCNQGLVDIV